MTNDNQKMALLKELKSILVELRSMAGSISRPDISLNSDKVLTIQEEMYFMLDAIHNLPENILEITDDVSMKHMIEKLSFIKPSRAESMSNILENKVI